MATVKIAGEDVVLPEMTVRVMRRVLPLVEQLQDAMKTEAAPTMEEVDRMVGLSMKVLATWLTPPPMFAPLRDSADPEDREPLSAEAAEKWIERRSLELEDRMTAQEAREIGPAVQAALAESGMNQITGEPQAPGAGGQPSNA